MSDQIYDTLSQLAADSGPAAAIDKLIESLRESKNYHKLFDALLMKKKFEWGLSVTRPTTFDEVPDEKRPEFEEYYVECAREVGNLLIEEGEFAQAWVYFRTIQESEPIRTALEGLGPEALNTPNYDELLNMALYEGAHPLLGIRWLLESHGTCNTITSLDQMMGQLQPAERREAAAVMVDHLYDELQTSLVYNIKQTEPELDENQSIRELIAGRDWLFENGNYHIDVSHLNAVVRFARFLEDGDSQLPKAIELAEYGSKLDKQLQYGGDPPFSDFYPAHMHYLNVLANQNVDEAFDYFQKELDNEPDAPDKQLIAYVMVDLLMRIGRLDQAVEIAKDYLADVEDPNSFSFADLCRKAGKADVLQEAARQHDDPLRFVFGLVSGSSNAAPA
jgi:tetratricopeptide (TPR) repeat protein